MFVRVWVLHLLLAGMLGGVANAASLSVTKHQIQQIDAAMHAVLEREHIAGMSIALAQNGRILYAHGYGYRDVARRLPADPETVYQIGSLTKQFTAAGILMLVRDGKLSLDAPLQHFFPAYRNAATVTISQLLTQTSGLPEYSQDTSLQTPEQILASVQGDALHFRPGERWEYSNTNYILLGLILEQRSGMTYADFVRTHITEPLHLHATGYTDLTHLPADVAKGTQWTTSGLTPMSIENIGRAFSAGGLSSNVGDLTTWDYRLLADRILPHALTVLMTTQSTLPDGTASGYAMGLMVSKMYGRTMLMHTGDIDGFSAFTGSLVDSHINITVLANTNAIDTIAIAKTLVGIVAPPTHGELLATQFHPAQNEDPTITAILRDVVSSIETGTLDRALLTDSFSHYLNDEKFKEGARYIQSLGAPTLYEFAGVASQGDMQVYSYRITFPKTKLMFDIGIVQPFNKVNLLRFAPAD